MKGAALVECWPSYPSLIATSQAYVAVLMGLGSRVPLPRPPLCSQMSIASGLNVIFKSFVMVATVECLCE